MGCSVSHCPRPAVARTFCVKHYRAYRKYGDPTFVRQKQYHGLTVEQRFWRYVGKQRDCWEWAGYKDPNGYGRLNVDGIPQLASRVSYLIAFGDVPAGKVVCHKCDNPGCVKPDHLFIGTQSDNVVDMHRKGRARKRGLIGTNHSAAKLNDDAAMAIWQSDEPVAVLAQRFGVSRATVHSVRVGKTWRHVTGGINDPSDNRAGGGG